MAKTFRGQEMLTPEEFARKYGWKNDMAKTRVVPAHGGISLATKADALPPLVFGKWFPVSLAAPEAKGWDTWAQEATACRTSRSSYAAPAFSGGLPPRT